MSNLTQINKLTPFGKFCRTIGHLPSSYMESMTYEEQLLWFCNFLQNEVIPTVNNNAGAVEELQNLFIELQNYVNNYFDNLDVQEEINNKLDEMAENGYFADVFQTYLNMNFTYYFENVEALKECEFLTNGNIAITNGYHSKDDGGNGRYEIISAPINNVDEGMYISLSNGKIAKLINTGVPINVKQFGAYGDGVHDDTEAIQNAIQSIDDLINPNTIYTIPNEIEIPTAKYKIEEKITLPPYIKLKCVMSVFESIVDDTTLSIEYTKAITDNENYYLSKSSFLNGDIISGGLTIIYKGNKEFSDPTNNHIGISVGNTNNTINNHISRCKFSDVSIFNFAKGLVINSINTYIMTFNHFHIEHNYTNIEVGNDNFPTASNSGENIEFNNCVIAGAVYGYKLSAKDFFTVDFFGCSMDYLACAFYFPRYNTNTTRVYGGHIESVGYYNNYFPAVNENTLPAFGCVGYYAGDHYPNGFTTLEFFGTWIQILSSNYKTNRFKAVSKDNFGVGFHGTRLLLNNDCSVEDTFLCDKNVFILCDNYDVLFDHDVSRNKILLSKRLDRFTIDDLTEISASTNDVKSGYRIGNSSQLALWSKEAISEFDYNSLCFTPGSTTKNALLYRKFNVQGYRSLVVTPVVKSIIIANLQFSMAYKFYDKDGNEMATYANGSDRIVKFSNPVTNNFNKASSAFIIEIPSHCEYVEVSIYIAKTDNTEFGENNKIYINGLFGNLIH